MRHDATCINTLLCFCYSLFVKKRLEKPMLTFPNAFVGLPALQRITKRQAYNNLGYEISSWHCLLKFLLWIVGLYLGNSRISFAFSETDRKRGLEQLL